MDKGAKLTLNELKLKEKNLLSKMKTIPEKERDYVELRRNQEISQGLYLLLLQKQVETALSLDEHTEFARIIDPPYALKKFVNPRKLYAAIGVLAMTLLIPIIGLFLKDMFISIKEEYKRTTL
jgi:uncharacterized protein involved in exopolysaccharide biosynthesis